VKGLAGRSDSKTYSLMVSQGLLLSRLLFDETGTEADADEEPRHDLKVLCMHRPIIDRLLSLLPHNGLPPTQSIPRSYPDPPVDHSFSLGCVGKNDARRCHDCFLNVIRKGKYQRFGVVKEHCYPLF
jgi:hypothetical protein